MYKTAVKAIVLIVVALAITPLPQGGLLGTAPAFAQSKPKAKKPGNIFEILFGKRGTFRERAQRARERIERGRRVRVERRRNRSGSRQPAGQAVARAPEPAAVEKSENAAKILIVGDFMAGGLAWGLEQLYAANANVIVVDQSQGLSGFVRDDVKDWPGSIAGHMDEFKPSAVVVLLGMNDRQQMRLPDGRVEKFTETWTGHYNQRVEQLANTVNEKGVPLIWMGLPPVRSTRMSNDYLVLNEIYREKSEAVGGAFVDIWDGFTNAEGKFVSAGPDVSGQIKRLRGSDGINMTRTGKRKLAFYAERAIRRATGIGNEQLLASLPGADASDTQTAEYDPASTGRTIVVSLAGPAVDGGFVLEGAGEIMSDESADQSVAYELVVNGMLSRPRPGRVDYASFSGAPEPVAEGGASPY